MFFIKSVWRMRKHETQRYQTSILVLKSISIWEISYLRALPWYDVFRFDVRIKEIFMPLMILPLILHLKGWISRLLDYLSQLMWNCLISPSTLSFSVSIHLCLPRLWTSLRFIKVSYFYTQTDDKEHDFPSIVSLKAIKLRSPV